MGFRVMRSNPSMDDLFVLQNTIHFGQDGWGDGSHLTKDELARLRMFHFKVEETEDLPLPDESDEEVEQETPSDSEENQDEKDESGSNDTASEDSNEEDEKQEAGETAQTKKRGGRPKKTAE